MAYQALYRAWRPNTFSEICDQDAVVRTLKRQVETKHIAHAYLFCGSRGTGKTSAAKVLSRAINCLQPIGGDPCGECEMCKLLQSERCMDVMEIDAASNNGVDEIRDLRDKIKYPPVSAAYKVYIIDEVHMLSTGAFNALLKTLEEPPAHAVMILATTEPQKIPATILSRCQRFDFHRISTDAIIARLEVVLAGIERTADKDALSEIARAAEGAMRDALSLLDVCLAFTEGRVTAELARDVLGTAGRDTMFQFTDALLKWDAAGALTILDECMRRGSDPRVFAQDVAAHLRLILLAAIAADALAQLADLTNEDAQRFAQQAQHSSEAQLTRMMALFMQVEGDIKWASMPRTIVELTTVRCCRPDKEQDSALTERIARIESMLERGIVPSSSQAPQATDESAQATPKPEAKPKPKPQPVAPAAKPPQEYLDALEILGRDLPSIRKMLVELRFGGIADNVVTLESDNSKLMVRKLLETKLDQLEKAFSESFSCPMRVRFSETGAAQAPQSRDARKVIEQSYDVFGRESVILTD